MAWRKSPLHIAALSFALAWELGITTSSAIPIQSANSRTSDGDRGSIKALTAPEVAAEPSPSTDKPSRTQQSPTQTWNAFEPPQRGVPGRREGGGTRGGDCKFDPNEMTALVPKTTMGRTLSANLMLWFYIPAAVDRNVEIALSDEANAITDKANKQDLYRKTFRLKTNKPGVVSVSIPAKGNSSLEIGKNYRWEMSVQCDPDDRSADIVVSGWIERVDLTPTLKNQLEQASARDRYSIYDREGLWYEAIATLAELRRSAPNDSAVANKWTELLKSVELDKIAQEPIMESQFRPTN